MDAQRATREPLETERRELQKEVIACLADGHWWTVGELSDTVDSLHRLVQKEIDWLLERGFVELFDDEDPPMYGWTVEPKAVERVTDKLREALESIATADVRYVQDGHGMAHNLYGESPHGFGYLGSAAPKLQEIARKALDAAP